MGRSEMKKRESSGKFDIDPNEKETDYTSMGISLGLCFGSALGLLFGMLLDNLTLGLCYGPGIGLCLGIVISSVMKKTNGDKKENKSEQESEE